MEEELGPVSASTLRWSIANTLRQAIVHGVWLPNTRLHEARIARQLGVSRAPVREALSQLEEEGLVRSEANRGTFVTELSPKDVEEIQSLREVLECFALRRGGSRLMNAGLAELEKILDEMRAAAEAGDRTKVLEKDLELHRLVCVASGHEHLLKLWMRLTSQIRRYMIANLQAVERSWGGLGEIVRSHEAILRALRDGDLAAAEAALRQHLIESAETSLRAAERDGDNQRTGGQPQASAGGKASYSLSGSENRHVEQMSG